MQPTLTPEQYVEEIRRRFIAERDPKIAAGQEQYMRNRYVFYGLKTPQYTAILKDCFSKYGLCGGQKLKTFVRLCYKDKYHEMFNAGLLMVEKQIKKQPRDFIDFLEKLIVVGDWWDTVDWINKFVSIHFQRYPDLQYPCCRKWIASENIWLQRIAIIHQLRYKEQTDSKLLFEMILQRKKSEEFFVQKGSGWALRQYSKYNAKAVKAFIERHPELPSLTKREGLKWLGKHHA